MSETPTTLCDAGARKCPPPGPLALGSLEPPGPEELPRLLPFFRFEETLTGGGAAAVYRGFDELRRHAVVLKILPSALRDNHDFVHRFLCEVRLLAALHHPGIAGVSSYGKTEEGHLYCATDFIEGSDLAQVLRSGPLSQWRALELTLEICEALRAAHAHGVIHHALEPAHILLTPGGEARLACFGLARPGPHGSDRPHTTPLAYLAPEQRAGDGDERADIFAMGVLLHEMLTGRRPEGIFAPPSARPGVDARMDQIVQRATQPAPERRYRHIGEMTHALGYILHPPTPPRSRMAAVRARGRRFGKGSVVATEAAAVLFCLALGARIISHREEPAPSRLETATWDTALPLKTVTEPVAWGWATQKPIRENTLGMRFIPLPDAGVLISLDDTRPSDYAAFATATGADPNLPDAAAFCAWLSQKEGLRYRLPTEREWSIAARLGLPPRPAEGCFRCVIEPPLRPALPAAVEF